LIDFLKKKWGKKLTAEFNASVSLFLARIKAFPKIYPATMENPDLRKAVISKQTTIIYRLKITEIEIVTLWDNRQDPSKNKV